MKKIAMVILAIFLASCQSNEQIDEQTSSDIEFTNNVEASSEEESEEAVIISFVGVGDNLIHDSIIADVYQEDGSYNFTPIYEHIASDIQDADLAFLKLSEKGLPFHFCPILMERMVLNQIRIGVYPTLMRNLFVMM